MQGPSEGDELSQLAPGLRAAARAPSPANTAALREYLQVRAAGGRQARRAPALNNATARQLSAAGALLPPAGAGREARQPARGLDRAQQAARRQRAPPAAPLLHHQVAVRRSCWACLVVRALQLGSWLLVSASVVQHRAPCSLCLHCAA